LEQNLLLTIKNRILNEINETLGRHPLYKDDTKAYHKYNMQKERPQSGVIMTGSSANREQLSPDDYMADLASHCSLAKAGTNPGISIEWVWEDTNRITRYVRDEDASSNLDPFRKAIYTENKDIVSGKANTSPATSFAQVEVKIDGVRTLASGINSKEGIIYLNSPVPVGSQVTVSYWHKDIDIPGYYFIEIVQKNSFIMTPLHVVKGEKVIEKTTGIETEAQLTASSGVQQKPIILWTKKNSNSIKHYLVQEEDFTVDSNGVLTFLRPLIKGTTLYASYRWQGPNRGPFEIKGEYTFNSEAIKGVSIAFGSRINVGDKQVEILLDNLLIERLSYINKYR
jgi:hypothetical protein